MIKSFGEIIDEVLTHIGKTQETVDPSILTSIQLRINQIQDYIFFHKNWDWRKRRFYFSTRAPLEDGTIAVTKGSRTITGTGTSFTNIVKFGYLQVGGRDYKVDPNEAVTATTCKIVAAYPEPTASGVAYKIIFPDYIIDPAISSILDLFIEGASISLTGQTRQVGSKLSVGQPVSAAMIGSTGFTYHSEGTVTMTSGSKAVVGVGASFSSEMEGMPFRVNEFSRTYIIQSVTDGDNLVLREEYQGDTGAGKAYKISPEDTRQIQLLDPPDDIYFVEIEALIRPPRLVNNNEISLVPNHDPLLFGTLWLALQDIKDEDNTVKIQSARSVFERSMKHLEHSYGQVGHSRWQSDREIAARRNSLTNFNPLRESDNRRI